jgi:hypothetical protein
MIQVILDGKPIEVSPELTIGKYQSLQKNPNKYQDKTELLALYLGITKDELRGLPVEQIKVVEGFLSSTILEPNTDEITFTFKIGETTYGIENEWGNMTWGQWVDMEVFGQPDKLTDNIHYLMALLYRPVKIMNGTHYELEPYDGSTMVARAELFKEKCPISFWFGASRFFFTISKEYTTHLENSLRWTTKMIKISQPILKILPKYLRVRALRAFTSTLPSDLQTGILRSFPN